MAIPVIQPEFTKLAMKRILTREGAEKVSDEAQSQLLETLNFLAKEIAHYAVKNARNAGKKVVTARDVRDATSWIIAGSKEE